jgi:hypothetical protein
MEDTIRSRFPHLYAIVRIDFPVNIENPENSVSVVKVFGSKLAAEREVVRLNKLNSGKGCRYLLNVTRLWPSPN